MYLMFNIDFRPDVFSSGWDLSDEWQTLRDRVNKSSSQMIESQQNSPEILSPFSYITEELVINTLRSSELPETVYWTLHYFIEANRNNPTIRTDRGKTVYLELDRLDDTITIYIGNSNEVLNLGQENGSQLFAMKLVEKYEYIQYPLLGSVAKRHYAAEALEKAHKKESSPANSLPVLFFTRSAGTDSNVCVSFVDWNAIAGKAVSDESTSQKQKASSDHASFSGQETAETVGMKIRSVFSARSGGKSDKSSQKDQGQGVLTA